MDTVKREKIVNLNLMFWSCMFILQPLLDVFSFFLHQYNYGNFSSTLIRGSALLAVISLGIYNLPTLGKKAAVGLGICLGGLAGFWILHIGISYGIGIRSWLDDLVNYSKFIQLPIVLIVFFLSLKVCGSKLTDRFLVVTTAVFWEILLLDAWAYGTGTAGFTYIDLKFGILGWYLNANAQSNILAILFPLALYGLYIINTVYDKKIWVYFGFLVTLVGGGVRLFFFGTRVTLYSLVCSLLVLVCIWLRRRDWRNWRFWIGSLLIAVALVIGFWQSSPMYNMRNIDTKIAGEDAKNILKSSEIDSNDTTVKNDEQYRCLYEFYMKNLVDEFGLKEVLQEYDYSVDFTVLRNVRRQKIHFAALRMKQLPTITKIFGLNFTSMRVPNQIGSYDLESDIHAVYYYYGYLGCFLCLLLLIYGLVKTVNYFKRVKWKNFLYHRNLWLFTYLIFLLGGVAFLGGSVLRRPSVSIYLAAILAMFDYELQSFGAEVRIPAYPASSVNERK